MLFKFGQIIVAQIHLSHGEEGGASQVAACMSPDQDRFLEIQNGDQSIEDPRRLAVISPPLPGLPQQFFQAC
jgi:hypothetical protein